MLLNELRNEYKYSLSEKIYLKEEDISALIPLDKSDLDYVYSSDTIDQNIYLHGAYEIKIKDLMWKQGEVFNTRVKRTTPNTYKLTLNEICNYEGNEKVIVTNDVRDSVLLLLAYMGKHMRTPEEWNLSIKEYINTYFNSVDSSRYIDDKDFARLFGNLLHYLNNFLNNKSKHIIDSYIVENNMEKIGNVYYKKGYEFYFVSDSITQVIDFANKIRNGITENENQVELFYRGQSNADWGLQAGIFRDNLVKYEKEIYNEVLSRVPFVFRNENTYENLLTIQHYEGPTRLLDITQNILIATFFSSLSELNSDGRIFLFKEKLSEIKYFNSDKVQIVANLSKMNSNFQYQAHKKYLYHEIRHYKPHFLDNINEKDLYNSYVVKGVMSNDRIENQNGDFILIGMNKNKKLEPAPIHQEMKNIVIIIDKKVKNKLIQQLFDLNIHEGTVYPEAPKKIKAIKDKWHKEVIKEKTK